MRGLHKALKPAVSVFAMFIFVCDAYSATPSEGRGNYDVRGVNRAGITQSTASQRMPTMPTLPGNSTGNLSPNLPSGDGSDNKPDEPDVNPPVQECPDGGVKDSDYKIENCMNDILTCVNNGALPNGLNDLFNEDLRNSIVNGMALCSAQVDRCISEVRKNCTYVYRSSADVWLDFNARKIQPEYYNFVLRKTGLTPNQAENTCLLLDRNTYGTSFNAVSSSGLVTAEYNNYVGAYNNQNGGVLIKNQPQGVQVNEIESGVDGQRGHYARWDPTTAECWLRVAAYNKDEHIKNSWLFGGAGDDQPAEVWKLAGDTFTCNKDLFGFSLMNKTSTAAVVGIGGGTVLGIGVGAIVGHGKRAFDCNIDEHRKLLTEEIRQDGNFGTLNKYLTNKISLTSDVMNKDQCVEVINLYDEYATELNYCNSVPKEIEITDNISETVIIELGANAEVSESCLNQLLCTSEDIKKLNETLKEKCDALTSKKELSSVFSSEIIELLQNGEKSNMGKSIGIGAAVGAGAGGLATAITAFVERSNINCRVGDGLAQVGMGKSYSIESLRDFYIKWNLRLPDTISPTAMVVDCDSWKQACATFTDLNQCKAAQINYKPVNAVTTTLVPTACTVSGSVCIENYPVAKSYGACE